MKSKDCERNQKITKEIKGFLRKPKDFQGKDIEEVSGSKDNFDISKISNDDLIDILDEIEFME